MYSTLKLFEEPAPPPPVTVQVPSGSWKTANSPFDGWTDDLDADPNAARPALVASPGQFVQGGNAYFTLRSVKSGTRYTYRVAAAKDKGGVFFVSLLAGPDNWENYRYMGMIRDRQFRTTAKSQYKADSTPVKAFAWTWERIAGGRAIDGVSCGTKASADAADGGSPCLSPSPAGLARSAQASWGWRNGHPSRQRGPVPRRVRSGRAALHAGGGLDHPPRLKPRRSKRSAARRRRLPVTLALRRPTTTMKRETYPTLTPEEMQALKSYAAYAGRTWKDELRRAWMSASLPGHLHKLRNSHGPSWLNQFQFPKEGN